jgi:hypothetical protein
MKKITLWGMLALTGLFTVFTACNKDEQPEPLSPGSAMVSGRLTANLDETDFQLQAVPAGTGVTFIIDGADLERNPQPGYNYEDVVVRGTTDADGNYSVSLPAVKKSINVQVVFDEFEFDANVLTTNDDGFQEAVIERRTFTRANASVSIIEGQVLVKDYNYNTGIGSFVPSAMIRGVVEAQITDNVGEPNTVSIDNAGTNYTNNTNVGVSGGTGSGMTVNTFTNIAGEVTNVFISDPGTGYTIGDVVTIQDGDNNATVEVTNVNPMMETVPEGVLLTFTVAGNPYKVVTDPNGEYMVKLPAGQGSASVMGADFETSSVYFEGGSFVTGPKIYSFINVANQGLTEGDIIELDLNYFRSN